MLKQLSSSLVFLNKLENVPFSVICDGLSLFHLVSKKTKMWLPAHGVHCFWVLFVCHMLEKLFMHFIISVTSVSTLNDFLAWQGRLVWKRLFEILRLCVKTCLIIHCLYTEPFHQFIDSSFQVIERHVNRHKTVHADRFQLRLPLWGFDHLQQCCCDLLLHISYHRKVEYMQKVGSAN